MNPAIKQAQAAALQWEVNNRTSLNRAVNYREDTFSPGCQYAHHFHGGCAVGRLLPEELARKLRGPISLEFNRLPEDVSCMGLPFLVSLQQLHDDFKNWYATGLSIEGLAIARGIATRYGLEIDFSKYEAKTE